MSILIVGEKPRRNFMYLIMLGAQGTGKGTVAGILAKETGWPQISTGDIFRANISNNTELGIKANEYISKGQLVPDDITVPMVINRLSEDDCRDGAILDGFPRTVVQAEKLDELIGSIDKAIYIKFLPKRVRRLIW